MRVGDHAMKASARGAGFAPIRSVRGRTGSRSGTGGGPTTATSTVSVASSRPVVAPARLRRTPAAEAAEWGQCRPILGPDDDEPLLRGRKSVARQAGRVGRLTAGARRPRSTPTADSSRITSCRRWRAVRLGEATKPLADAHTRCATQALARLWLKHWRARTRAV